MSGFISPQVWVIHQRPGNLKVLHSIFVVLRTELFCTEIWKVVHGICRSHSSSLGTTDTTQAQTPHHISVFPFSLWYFSSFSCTLFVMLSSIGIATYSIITLFFCCFLTSTIFCWLANISHLQWTKDKKDL